MHVYWFWEIFPPYSFILTSAYIKDIRVGTWFHKIKELMKSKKSCCDVQWGTREICNFMTKTWLHKWISSFSCFDFCILFDEKITIMKSIFMENSSKKMLSFEHSDFILLSSNWLHLVHYEFVVNHGIKSLLNDFVKC